MGSNIPNNMSFIGTLASSIGSFMRSSKVKGDQSATGADSNEALFGKHVDEFEGTMALQNANMNAENQDVNFTAETEVACEWASGQSLAEAVDHFENDEVGNGLMLMSVIPDQPQACK